MKITSDSFNPVLIKELRQYFHGKIFMVIMGLLLLSQLGILFIIYANNAQDGNETSSDMGGILVSGVIVTFILACLLLCGATVINRFAHERSNPELDFTRFCAMSPLQILWGKMTSSYAIASYLLSLCLPFIVIAYFLRGLSILEIALAVGFAIIGTLFVIQISLFIGTTGQRNIIALLVFFCLWAGFGLIGLATAIISQIVRHHTSTNVPALIGLVILLSLAGIGFIFVLNLAMLSAPLANRMLPTRIYIIAFALLSPVIGLIICHISIPKEQLAIVLPPSIVVGLVIASCLCSFIAAFERSLIGPRVQRQCPQALPERFGFFLISSGSGGGITLAWLLQLAACAAAFITAFNKISISEFRIGDRFIILSFGFAFLFYEELALFVHKRLKIYPFVAWLIVTVVAVFIPVFLYAFAEFTYEKSGYDFNLMLVTTPFHLIALNDNSLKVTDIFCWIWPFFALVGLGFAYPFMLEQFKSLRIPPEK